MKSYICKLWPTKNRFKVLILVFYVMAILTSLIGMNLIKFSSKEVSAAASRKQKSDEDEVFFEENFLPKNKPAGKGNFKTLIFGGQILEKLKGGSATPKRFFSKTNYIASNYKLKYPATSFHVRNTSGTPTTKELKNLQEVFEVSNSSKSFIISAADRGQTIHEKIKSSPSIGTQRLASAESTPRNSGQNTEKDKYSAINLNCLVTSFPTNTLNTFKLPSNFQVTSKNSEHILACGINSLAKPWRFLDQKYFDMIFLVKTAPRNIRYREMVRRTWGRIQSIRGMNFATIFLLGTTNATKKNELLNEENNIFGDILQCNYQDTYRNLPIKMLSSMRWLLEDHVSATYYTVTDDDCVMDLLNVNAFFREEKDENVVHCGFVYDDKAKPHRRPSDKWFVNESIYSLKIYPTFCHGGMWTVQRSLMRDLLCIAEQTDRHGFHLEDVYITGILREKLGRGQMNIKPVLTRMNQRFNLMYYPWVESNKALKKIALKWKKLNSTLPWKQLNNSEKQLMTIYDIMTEKSSFKNLVYKWKTIENN